MKKFGLILAAFAAVLIMMGGTAEAATKRTKVTVTPAPWYWWGTGPRVTVAPAPWYWGWTAPWQVRNRVLAGSNFVVGAASTGAYFAIRNSSHGWRGTNPGAISSGGGYALTAVGCAALSPIVGTAVTGRPLTQREVFVSTANCALPVVGGWAMNYWFDVYGWDRPKGKRG